MRSLHSKLMFLALLLGSMAVGVSAQTKPKQKPLATPLPVLTGAEIISRAEDYVEAPPTQPEKPAVKPNASTAAKIKDINERLKNLETGQKTVYDEKQKRLLLNLDILTRAEQRTESLRKQLFEMIEKENTVKSRLDQIDIDIRPEMIERTLQLMGSMKPEEVRENKRKSLAAERANLQSLLSEIQTTRSSISFNLQKAEQMVEKLRTRLEKDIDNALVDDEPEN